MGARDRDRESERRESIGIETEILSLAPESRAEAFLCRSHEFHGGLLVREAERGDDLGIGRVIEAQLKRDALLIGQLVSRKRHDLAGDLSQCQVVGDGRARGPFVANRETLCVGIDVPFGR